MIWRDHLVVTAEVVIATLVAFVTAEWLGLRVIETWTVAMLIWIYVQVRIRP